MANNAKLLEEIKSSSSSNVYKIIRGEDGQVYCTCKGWQNRGYCKHLTNYWSRHMKDNEPIYVGDTVMITRTGDCYSVYSQWAEWAGATKFLPNEEPNKGMIGIVKFIGNHDMKQNSQNSIEELIALVDCGRKEYLMAIEGLVLLKRHNSNDEWKSDEPDVWNMTKEDFVNLKQGREDGNSRRNRPEKAGSR